MMSADILSDLELQEEGDAVVALFSGLILIADDYGIFQAHPMYVAGQVYRFGQHNAAETKVMLETLARKRFILPFESAGRAYYAMRSWFKHQSLYRPRALTVRPPDDVIEELARCARDEFHVRRIFSETGQRAVVSANESRREYAAKQRAYKKPAQGAELPTAEGADW
jgi:hypothetical protein